MTSDDSRQARDARAPDVKVMVMEDEAPVRDGLAAMVEATPGLELWGVADALAAARARLVAQGAPDVAVIDLGLADGVGTELIRDLATAPVAASTLAITVPGDEAHLARALQAGARGYLLKDSTLDEFAHAIRLVHERGTLVSPQVLRDPLERYAEPVGVHERPAAVPGEPDRLSAREAEILGLIARGHAAAQVAQVAQRLHLSPHTVAAHIKHIDDKLAVNNRMQAVNRARATGQIE